MATEAFAPAKINLTLHVTGRRADGYHLLDSLVAFADVGDRVRASPAPDLSLVIEGPMAAGLGAERDNLVLRAARFCNAEWGRDRGVQLTLHKELPVASGIGGGSADAAATIRALSRLWSLPLPGAAELAVLGADVPVCLASRTVRMRGIGERLDPVAALPEGLSAVLVNPGVGVSTPEIFRALASPDLLPMDAELPRLADARAFCDWLARQRNDLQAAAQSLQPVIGEVLEALAAQEPLLARMSGSGATCFGLFATREAARRAARAIAAGASGWWVRDCGFDPLTTRKV